MKEIFFLILFIVFFSDPVSADKVYLKSGKVVEGTIIHSTPIFVRIEPKDKGMNQEFLIELIEKIEKGPIIETPIEEIEPVVKKKVVEPMAETKIEIAPTVAVVSEVKEDVDLQAASEISQAQSVQESKDAPPAAGTPSVKMLGTFDQMKNSFVKTEDMTTAVELTEPVYKETEQLVEVRELDDQLINQLILSKQQVAPKPTSKNFLNLSPKILIGAGVVWGVLILILILASRRGKKKDNTKASSSTKATGATPVKKPSDTVNSNEALRRAVLGNKVPPKTPDVFAANVPTNPTASTPVPTSITNVNAPATPPVATMTPISEAEIPTSAPKPKSIITEKTYWLQIPRIMQYPLKGHVLSATIGGTVFFCVLQVAMMSIFYGLIAMIIFGSYTAACVVNIIETAVSSDRDDIFEWPDFLHVFEWVGKAILFVLATIISYLPLFLYFFILFKLNVFDSIKQIDPNNLTPVLHALAPHAIVGIILLIFAAFIGPMYTMSVSLIGGLGSLNPVVVLSAIGKTFVPYTLTVLFLGILQAINISTNFIPILGIPFWGAIFKWFVFVYFLFVNARLLGIFYRAHRMRLQWYGEDERDA